MIPPLRFLCLLAVWLPLMATAQTRVFCDGNSLTAGSCCPGQDYPSQLGRLLQSTGMPVYNYGIDGLTTTDMINMTGRIDDAQLYNPFPNNILIVWEVTNDLAIYGKNEQQAFNNIKQYCLERKSKGFKVVVATMLPRTAIFNFYNAGTIEAARTSINTRIRNEWATFADALSDVGDLDVYRYDGVHLTGAGYAVIAAKMKDAVLSITNAPVSISSITASSNPVCAGTTTTLTATGVQGINPVVTWYTGPAGTGTNLGTGTTLANRTAGTYYARVTGNSAAAEASITITSATNVGITSISAAANPIVPGSTTTLTANGVTGTNAVVNWYNQPGGSGNNFGAGITLNDANPGNYYARVTGTCGVPKEVSITIDKIVGPCINDRTPPVIVAKNITINADASGNASIQPGDVIQSITDNCTVDNASLVVSQTNFVCGVSGTGNSNQAYVAPTNQGNQGFTGELGMEFRVNDPAGIVISKLGAFDDKGNGIAGTQNGGVRVAVFNKTTKTIVQGLDVTIAGTADPLVNNFRVKGVSPVKLPAGDYVLVTKGFNKQEMNGNHFYSSIPVVPGETDGGAISYLGTGRYGNPDITSFGYPAYADNGLPYQYLAGTFNFSKVGTGGNNVHDVTITVKDANGNTATATATVTVVCSGNGNGNTCANDVTPPVITPKNISVNADANGNANITAAQVIQSVTDNCTVNMATATVTPSSFACSATADTDHQAYVTSTNKGNQNWTGELGLDFNVNNAQGIQITQLGAFDHKGDGISGTQSGGVRVAVFNKATQAVVPGLDVIISGKTDPLVNNFRFKTVSPVILPAGQYVIVAKGYNANELNGNASYGMTIPQGDASGGTISYTGSRYGNAGTNTFTFPQFADKGVLYQYVAGTFIYSKPGGGSNVHNVTISVKDAAGNLSTSTATVTVICNGAPDPCATDATAPVITSKNITVNTDANGNASIVPADVIQSLTDNCAVDMTTVTVSPSTFTCATTVGSSHQTYVAPTDKGNQIWAGELGLDFTVNDAKGIQISQLGAFDHKGDGINGTQNGGVRVAVFNKTTQTIVPGLDVIISGKTDALVNHFRFKSVTPVILPPGQYVIVAKGYNYNELNGNASYGMNIPQGDLASGAISYAGSRYGNPVASGFAFPQNADKGLPYQYLAGTFVYATITGNGNNVQTVTIKARDQKGNEATATATVTVVCAAAPVNQVSAPAGVSEKAGVYVQPTEAATTYKAGLYPNPSTGRFTITLENVTATKATVQVLTQTGMLVENKEVELAGKSATSNVSFDLSNKPAGIYLVRIVTKDGVQTKKVVISR